MEIFGFNIFPTQRWDCSSIWLNPSSYRELDSRPSSGQHHLRQLPCSLGLFESLDGAQSIIVSSENMVIRICLFFNYAHYLC